MTFGVRLIDDLVGWYQWRTKMGPTFRKIRGDDETYIMQIIRRVMDDEYEFMKHCHDSPIFNVIYSDPYPCQNHPTINYHCVRCRVTLEIESCKSGCNVTEADISCWGCSEHLVLTRDDPLKEREIFLVHNNNHPESGSKFTLQRIQGIDWEIMELSQNTYDDEDSD